MFRAIVVCAVACATVSAASKCSTKCSDEDGASVLTFKAEDVVMDAGEQIDANGNLVTSTTVALAKALGDIKNGGDVSKSKLNALMDKVLQDYRDDLGEIDDENNEKYGNFVTNHEAVVEADTDEFERLRDMKDRSSECQTKHLILKTNEDDDVLGGWDRDDVDGITELEGNSLGKIAKDFDMPTDAGSECLPAVLEGCSPDQVLNKIWGYDYDYLTHIDAEDLAEEDLHHVSGLERIALKRTFVNNACSSLTGSSCETMCPKPPVDPRTGEPMDHYTPGPNIMYTCQADGTWKAELKEYSKIKVFTHVGENDAAEWADYANTEVDCQLCTDEWPKWLNLDVDLYNHDPIVTLQSYLNFRGIKCDVWNSKFGSDANKVSIKHTEKDADGNALFLHTATGKIETESYSLNGADWVEIPANLCTSAERQRAVDNGAIYFIPGKYNFKIRGGAKVLKVVFTNQLCHGGFWSPGHYATRYSGVGSWNPKDCQTKLATNTGAHGGRGCSKDIFGVAHNNGHCWCVPPDKYRAATEDCHSFGYGTTHTWKNVQGEIDAPANLYCNGTYVDVDGTSTTLIPAGTGLPKKYAKRNSDPQYGERNGWFFRVLDEEGTKWEFVKQGLLGYTIKEGEAAKAGWSNALITETANGDFHGPFGTDIVAKNTKVQKSFKVPDGATSCDIKVRYWRQWTWDHEWAYVTGDVDVISCSSGWDVSGKQCQKRGVWTCNNYGWNTQANDMPKVSGGSQADCWSDVTANVKCVGGTDLKVGISSSIDQRVADESWGFSNLEVTVHGVPGELAGLTVHRFDTEMEGKAAPNGKSDFFDASKSASGVQSESFACASDDGGDYAGGTYASTTNLKEDCVLNRVFKPPLDDRVSMDKIIAWWKMENFDADNWVWESMVEHYDTGEYWKADFVNKGNLKLAMGGEGAHDEYLSLEGDTNSDTKISWGNIVQDRMSFCTTSSYRPSGGSTGRVFRGARSNWLHGHWNGFTRTSHYDGWILHPYYSPSGWNSRFKKDWIVMCQSSKSASGGNGFQYGNIYGWNGDYSKIDTRSTVYGSRWNQNELVIGRCGRRYCGCCTREESGFRVAEVMAWNRGMDQDELKLMMRYLMERLTGEAT